MDLSTERKYLIEKGDLPEWITTPSWKIIKNKYLSKKETYRERLKTVAKVAASHSNDPLYWSEIFFNLMWKGWLSPSTPVLSNMGTNKGLPVSCQGSYMGDSIYDIFETRKNLNILTKNGFGTSVYLGDIRHRGASISVGGTAEGLAPIVKAIVSDMQYTSQGSTRRGACASYVPIDHPDFYEIADIIRHSPDDLNIGWTISNNFLDKLNSKDPDSLNRYKIALWTKCQTGKGYFWLVDKANNHMPDCYKDNGLYNKASNLCVAPETQILTDLGYLPIEELEGQQVNVWNGEEFSQVKVRQTSEKSKLIKVITNSGQEIECTEYHKFYVKNNYNLPVEERRAKDLVPGDKLIKFDLPVIQGTKTLTKARTNGFFSGDGCHYKGKNIVYLYHNKVDILNTLELDGPCCNQIKTQNRLSFPNVTGLKDKLFVPTNEYTIDSRLQWLSGLLDSDGTVARNGTNEALQIASVQKGFLLEVQLMLQTLGVTSKVTKARQEGQFLLPANDGSGGNKYFNCKEVHRLLISSSGLYKLSLLGLECHRLNWEVKKPQRSAEQFIKVESVVDEGRQDKTYCFTEPKRNMGMFNGLLTGQCSEILLPSDQDHDYTCILSSMNLAKYDEWKGTEAVFQATVFLDCVASEFLAKAKNIKGLERAINFTKKFRALGLGVMGFHTYVQDKGWAWGDLDTMYFNREVFQHLKEETYKASGWLAKVLGTSPEMKPYGRRNGSLIAVAPTMSTALIMGGVSQGIEPVVGNAFVQASAGGEVRRINPTFLKLLKDKGIYTDEIIKSVVAAKGSCQHLEQLTDREKLVFRTAFEIDQEVIIRLANQRQEFIDQGQSLNLFVDANVPEAYISKLHQIAFESKYLFGLYYLRTQAGVDIKIACESCAS